MKIEKCPICQSGPYIIKDAYEDGGIYSIFWASDQKQVQITCPNGQDQEHQLNPNFYLIETCDGDDENGAIFNWNSSVEIFEKD